MGLGCIFCIHQLKEKEKTGAHTRRKVLVMAVFEKVLT